MQHAKEICVLSGHTDDADRWYGDTVLIAVRTDVPVTCSVNAAFLSLSLHLLNLVHLWDQIQLCDST